MIRVNKLLDNTYTPKMKPNEKTILIALITLIFLASIASAKYITLTQTLSMERIILGDETTINLTLNNQGDEAAYDVQLSLIMPDGMVSQPIYLGKMDPNTPQNAVFNITINPSLKSGGYTLGVLTEYKDANGYPFSSVSPYSVYLKQPVTSQVAGTIQEQTLGTKGGVKATIELRNLDDQEKTLSIKVYGPKELIINPEEKTIKLAAKSQQTTDLEISSFGALAGSNYVVFAALDYEDAGIHHSSTATGMIKVIEQQDALSFSGWLPYAVFAVLIILVIAYQFKK
jgi:hypothetical protein